MKQITKGKDRHVGVALDGSCRSAIEPEQEWIIIEERTSYLPMGHGRRKWESDKIALTRDELAKIVAWYEAEGAKRFGVDLNEPEREACD